MTEETDAPASPSPSAASPTLGAPQTAFHAAHKARFASFVSALQDRFVAAFEEIEVRGDAALYDRPAGRFEKTPWRRGAQGMGHVDAPSDTPVDSGGGVAALMRGRVLEKVGVHVSEVYGAFSPEMAERVPGASEDPSFWACGLSLIAHPTNPRAPTAHMNTRMIVTTKGWFGGGGDLTPLLDVQRRADAPDAVRFHAALEAACARHGADLHPRFKDWCDRYFYLPHRQEPRGIGGIFYDEHSSGDWEADFAFTCDAAEAFLQVYCEILKGRINEPWSEQERAEQLARRGRYVEFNLLYDRGTLFGLKTGGNIDTILSSMPPVVTW